MDKDIITDYGNLYRAYRKAKSGKKFNSSTAKFSTMALEGVTLLKEQLENQTYRMSLYNEFKIYEQFANRFPDMRVIVEEPKKRKSSYIPYSKMILYISYQENAKTLLLEFNDVRQKSLACKNSYKYVYDWFISKFREYGKPEKKAS